MLPPVTTFRQLPMMIDAIDAIDVIDDFRRLLPLPTRIAMPRFSPFLLLIFDMPCLQRATMPMMPRAMPLMLMLPLSAAAVCFLLISRRYVYARNAVYTSGNVGGVLIAIYAFCRAPFDVYASIPLESLMLQERLHAMP